MGSTKEQEVKDKPAGRKMWSKPTVEVLDMDKTAGHADVPPGNRYGWCKSENSHSA